MQRLALNHHRALLIRRILFAALAIMLIISMLLQFMQPASAAIGFRAAQGANNAGGATTLTINKPTGTTEGDVLIAVISVRGGTGTTVTAPTGWVGFGSLSSSTVIRSESFYKYATSSEGADYTFTFNNSEKASGVIGAYSGVDSLHARDLSSTSSYAASATLTAPSVTTTLNNTMVIAGYSTAVGTTMTAGSSMTLRGQSASTGGSAATRTTTGLQDISQASAGSTGTKNMTAGASAVHVGHMIVLRPKLDMKMSAYRWFANANSTTPGSALAAQDTQASMGAGPVRLQMLSHIQDGKTSSHHGAQLRYSERGADNSCDVSGTNETYQTIASRAKTKAHFASTAANDTGDGTVAWNTPDGGKIPDVTNATVAVSLSNTTSNYLKLTNFGLDVPGTATITGITATASVHATAATGGTDDVQLMITAVKGGTIQSTFQEMPIESTSSSNYQRFDPSLYGTSFTASDVNNSNFGIALQAYTDNSTFPNTATISSVSVQVTYTDGGRSRLQITQLRLMLVLLWTLA